eukprot:scaffold234788_cov32-Tisochrysis_lutea.AAC.1
MHHQIPLEFKSRWCTYTKMHARAWRGKRPDWKNDDVEKSMGKMHTALRPHHFDLWVAARVRVAQLKPEFTWLNRHGSFCDGNSTANTTERGGVGRDDGTCIGSGVSSPTCSAWHS